ncbi:hypothetical protein [Variovorax sp. WDL1]|uniref:hypothetical protein n=1 Tax=Variovorax sp. WDL1 TaxID=207745 RepID=UPI001E559635|nr:hypothetical protein [Variovorax sp. WDL1]
MKQSTSGPSTSGGKEPLRTAALPKVELAFACADYLTPVLEKTMRPTTPTNQANFLLSSQTGRSGPAAKAILAGNKFPKPIYLFDVKDEEDRKNLRTVRDVLVSMAEPLGRDVTLYHWSTTQEGAQGIVDVGTGPGMKQGLGQGMCGRGFYVSVAEAGDAPPQPMGVASTHENRALLRITQAAHGAKILNSNNLKVQDWFVQSGLSGDDPHGADDIQDAFTMIDKVCPEIDDLPSLIVVMRGKYECQEHDPRPGDSCVIKYPIVNGEAGCSITVVDNPAPPPQPETPDSPRDGEGQLLSQGWSQV